MRPSSVSTHEATARARLYGFLAEVLSAHPDPEQIRGVCELAADLGISRPGDVALSALGQEYMELFVVPGTRYVAPYESVFRDYWLVPPVLRPGSNPAETGKMIKGLVMGESTEQVRQCYVQAGIFPDEELPDHIGNELRFMAHLWARETEAGDEEAGRLADLREAFRREHLLQWIRPLGERVRENDRLGYYRVALDIAAIVIESDTECSDRGPGIQDKDDTPPARPPESSRDTSTAPAGAPFAGARVGKCPYAAAGREHA
jgi:TorA maturation chaperone TorD